MATGSKRTSHRFKSVFTYKKPSNLTSKHFSKSVLGAPWPLDSTYFCCPKFLTITVKYNKDKCQRCFLRTQQIKTNSRFKMSKRKYN